jgi:bacteriocin-like protein
MNNKQPEKSEKKTISGPDELLKKDKKGSVELTDDELDKVSGGDVATGHASGKRQHGPILF